MEQPAFEISISANTAVSSPGRPATDDSLASQRAEFNGRTAKDTTVTDQPGASDTANLILSALLADLKVRLKTTLATAGAGAGRQPLEAALGKIEQAESALAHRSGEGSVNIAELVAIATSAEQEVDSATNAERLATACEDARKATDAIMSGMKDFDPYLRFSSAEDEREYRERERERQAQIEKEKDKGTPEGDRNAFKIARAQLIDAGAHGADRSPDYQTRLNSADQALAELASVAPDRSADLLPTSATVQHDADLSAAIAALNAAGVKGPPTQDAAGGHGLTMATAAVNTISI